jgi:hypothetical protein
LMAEAAATSIAGAFFHMFSIADFNFEKNECIFISSAFAGAAVPSTTSPGEL